MTKGRRVPPQPPKPPAGLQGAPDDVILAAYSMGGAVPLRGRDVGVAIDDVGSDSAAAEHERRVCRLLLDHGARVFVVRFADEVDLPAYPGVEMFVLNTTDAQAEAGLRARRGNNR